MQEVNGQLWDYHKAGEWICITTNGFINKAGEVVMGRGCAAEAKVRFPRLPKQIAKWQRLVNPDNPIFLVCPEERLVTFPVKYKWFELANLDLIGSSAKKLAEFMAQDGAPPRIFLPRPGCGNGKLAWEDVKAVIEPILPDSVVVITWVEVGAGAAPQEGAAVAPDSCVGEVRDAS